MPVPTRAMRTVWVAGVRLLGAFTLALILSTSSNARAEVLSPGALFRPELVREIAQRLAAEAYVPPASAALPPLDTIGYDQWRDIRHLPERAIWHGEGLGFEIQLFLASFIYRHPVDLFLVENGTVAPLRSERDMFDLGPLERQLPPDADLRPSGFRMHGPINRSDQLDEIIVFLGASYFRALGRGHGYGLSARGLAVNTMSEESEEFPRFRRFWIEQPLNSTEVRVHALLDSVSITGAFHMLIRPGQTTEMDVEAHLFPRVMLANIGIAPLTSMFLFNTVNRASANDFRSEVHDSDGLAVLTGTGERLWRPLNKPRILQVSAFVDRNPRGFGLIQRERSFSAYQDLEARYERRPSAWVEPRGDWGEGAVELIELSTGGEYADNIIAFWRPAHPLQPGQDYTYVYRLSWTDDVIGRSGLARVAKTRIGAGSRAGSQLFVIDFEGLPAPGDSGLAVSTSAPELPTPVIQASAGVISGANLRTNPETGGMRLSFHFEPQKAALSELRAQLFNGATPIAETWLYRWTPNTVGSAAAERTSSARTLKQASAKRDRIGKSRAIGRTDKKKLSTSSFGLQAERRVCREHLRFGRRRAALEPRQSSRCAHC